MTPDQVWVPVQRRWADIRPGDVIVGRDGQLWSIQGTWHGLKQVTTTAVRGSEEIGVDRDPDAEVTVRASDLKAYLDSFTNPNLEEEAA